MSASVKYEPLSSDEDHEVFLSRFYEKYHIDEADVVFKATQDKRAVIIALEKEQDESKQQLGRLLCFYIKNIENSKVDCKRSQGTFMMLDHNMSGCSTPILHYRMGSERIICSYLPSPEERAKTFLPYIAVNKVGERCEMSLGRGVMQTLAAEQETSYACVFYIYVCPYKEELDIIFEAVCLKDQGGDLRRSIIEGHDVLGIPRSMPRLVDNKDLMTESFSECVIRSEGCCDFLVRLNYEHQELGPDHYHSITILRCLTYGVEQEECVIKLHRIQEEAGQIVLFCHDKKLATFSCLRALRSNKWVQEKREGLLRIKFCNVMVLQQELKAKIEYWLNIRNDKGCLLITQETKAFPKPVKDDCFEKITEVVSLYPKADKRHFESKFLDGKAPLKKLLGYPYDRDYKEKKRWFNYIA